MGLNVLVKQPIMENMSTIIVLLWLCWLMAAIALGTHPLLSLTAFLMLCGYIFSLARSKAARTIHPEVLHDMPAPNVSPTGLTNALKHDLYAPIRLIIGFCDAIFRAAGNDDLSPALVTENVKSIKRNAQQLETLITALSTQSNPKTDISQEQLEPSTLIAETAALIRDLMESRNIHLKVDIPDPLPLLSFNRMILRQILLNLLRSIGQWATDATITLRATIQSDLFVMSLAVSLPDIRRTIPDKTWEGTQHLVILQYGRLWIENDSSTIVLSFPIADQIPIASSVHSTDTVGEAKPAIVVVTDTTEVIDLFRQHIKQYEVVGISDVEALRTLTLQPVGVILSQEPNERAIEIVRVLFGGHIPIVSCPILDPLQQMQVLKTTFLSKPVDYDLLSEALFVGNRSISRILIVDDNSDSTTLLMRMLASMPAKYVTQNAHTAYDTLRILHDNLSAIDALILDVSLPDMDGISLVRQLRANPKTAELPIILISAHHTLEFILPETISASISIVQPTDKFPTTLEAIFNSLGVNGSL